MSSTCRIYERILYTFYICCVCWLWAASKAASLLLSLANYFHYVFRFMGGTSLAGNSMEMRLATLQWSHWQGMEIRIFPLELPFLTITNKPRAEGEGGQVRSVVQAGRSISMTHFLNSSFDRRALKFQQKSQRTPPSGGDRTDMDWESVHHCQAVVVPVDELVSSARHTATSIPSSLTSFEFYKNSTTAVLAASFFCVLSLPLLVCPLGCLSIPSVFAHFDVCLMCNSCT